MLKDGGGVGGGGHDLRTLHVRRGTGGMIWSMLKDGGWSGGGEVMT
jgi:hypothetical protein